MTIASSLRKTAQRLGAKKPMTKQNTIEAMLAELILKEIERQGTTRGIGTKWIQQ